MRVLEQLDIYLDRNYEVFESGDWLVGKVVVKVREELKMQGIHVAFKGEAEVDWSHDELSSSSSDSDYDDEDEKDEVKKNKAKETYFDNTITLFGKSKGHEGNHPVLTAGKYSYPFEFQLPENLPASYEGDFGFVRYQIKATISIPWKFDHRSKRPFTVVPKLDLNDEHHAAVAQEGHDEKMICCLCCAAGPVTAQLKIDRSGYVPGEYATFKGEVNNRSTRTIDGVSIGLYAKTTFRAQKSKKEVLKLVCEIERDGLDPGQKDSFKNLSLHIPPLPPSYLKGCDIIDIVYILKLIVDPSGPALDLEVPLEIIIGTIPLKNAKSSFVLNSFQRDKYKEDAWQHDVDFGLADEDEASCPPLTFEQCVWEHKSITVKKDKDFKEKKKMEWNPSYPYFSWGKDLETLDEEDVNQV